MKIVKGCFLEVAVQYTKCSKLHDLHNDLSISSKKMKIEKVRKLVTKLHDKNV